VPAAFSEWRFDGAWRRYQVQCLEAFEADRAAGRHQTLLVAPPGSGKTVVGLEIVRRLGVPAAVLCPSRTIQRQWAEKQALFGASSADLHALTYQSLCQTSDPEGLLREAALRVWTSERATATGQSPQEVAAQSWEGEAARRREREIGRIVARVKRDVAAGRLPDLPAAQLLSESALARVGALRDAGVRVVVLDECHHLLSLWGALLAAVLELLEPMHVLGLTATNPKELTAEQAALYAQLLDGEDFSVPTPAVVREGHLAPYQELVQLCTPLASECEWLADRHARFDASLLELSAAPEGSEHLGLDVWLVARLSERSGAGGGQLSWGEFARARPRLADAGLRGLHARGTPAPADAPRGERYRAAPSIEDWVVLLEDYALRCLGTDPSAEAQRRLDALQVALGDLGFAVTRQGIRRVGGEVDRVLLSSAGKPMAMCDALACESDGRGAGLRALVLCDSERPPRQPEGSPLALTGGGRGLLAAIGADERLIGSRPALVTGETFAVVAVDVDWWAARLDSLADDWAGFAGGLRGEADGELVVWRHRDARFDSQTWTAWATRLLAGGEIQVLVGTRGLLGEGWDCPPVNVLVDMTAVAADVSVRQMRGRSLRLDPLDPAKLANNWDIVCVAPQLGRGLADYGRFVRRHQHLHAPCEDGTIETGPSHVHPELSPFAPPAEERFVAINIEQQERAVDRDAARDRWRIGEPYRGVDLDVLVVRNPPRVRGDEPTLVGLEGVAPSRRAWRSAASVGTLLAAGAVTAAGAVVAAPVLLVIGGAGLLAGGAGTAAARTARRRAQPESLPLEWAAGAVCDAYVALGELAPEALRTLRFGVRPEGWVRVSLPDAEPQVSRLVSAALDELFGGGALARYVVSRRVGGGPFSRSRVAWHAVPADLARRKERATAFAAAWRHWMGAGELVYCHGGDERGRQLASLASALPVLETQRRSIWR
jgi:hypothetical protein